MSVSKRELRKYLRQIKAELLCPCKERNRILGDLKESISGYLDEHPEATIESVRAFFGSAQQIAASYVEELPTPELMQKLKLRRNILRYVVAIVGSAALLCVALWIATIVTALISVHNSSDPHVEIYIEEE